MFKQLQKFFFPSKGLRVSRTSTVFSGKSKNVDPKLVDQARQVKQQGDYAMLKGALEEAETCYRKALAFDPDFAEAYNNLGLALDKLERFGEAVDCYFKALSIDPAHAAACLNLGNWHRAHGNIEEQVHFYEKALALKPDYYEAYNNLGSCFQAQGKLDEAVTYFKKALALKPDYAWAMLNMAACCRARKDIEEEIKWLRKALAAAPKCAAASNQLGYIAFENGEQEAAMRHFRDALACDPDLHNAQFNLGALLLMQGNYAEGLELYESRFKMYPKQILGYDTDYFPVTCRAPRWDGKDAKGKTLLIWIEQGLGDNLMMMRYLPKLLEMGCHKLVVNSRPELSRLFRHQPYPVEVVETEEELRQGTYDYHCPMTSLPYLLGTRLETIPHEVPYISISDEMKHQCADRLASLPGLKVGLVWAGNKSLGRDALRSVSFATYEPLKTIPGITFISLQKGESAEQARHADWVRQEHIEECRDFLDTAALVEHLDLVISVDTSTVHLAGALGKPVWLLNRFESEWRWMRDREYSPWYPTIRVFRQPALHDWASVMTQIASELDIWAATVT